MYYTLGNYLLYSRTFPLCVDFDLYTRAEDHYNGRSENSPNAWHRKNVYCRSPDAGNTHCAIYQHRIVHYRLYIEIRKTEAARVVIEADTIVWCLPKEEIAGEDMSWQTAFAALCVSLCSKKSYFRPRERVIQWMLEERPTSVKIASGLHALPPQFVFSVYAEIGPAFENESSLILFGFEYFYGTGIFLRVYR